VTTAAPFRWAVLLALCAGVPMSCSDDDPHSAPEEQAILALLSDGRVVSGTTARVREAVRLTRQPLRATSGRLLAVTPDRRRMGVLLTTAGSRRSEVVVLTARGLRVRARIPLPLDRKTRATALVAPTSNRLVALGERETRAGGRLPVGWVIDISSAELVSSWRVPKGPDRNWTVFDAAPAPDSKRLYLSYHGGCNATSGRACTTGVDIVSWENGQPLCVERPRSSAGCIGAIHGEVASLPGGVLGTGGDPIVLRANTETEIVQRWSSRLTRNHLVRLAYDPASKRVFTVGSCLYAGGLARIDLDAGWQWRRGGRNAGGRQSMCGERIDAGSGHVVFTEGPEWAGGSESEITVADAETGSIRARLPINAPAVDLTLVR
jgi:hypothetical protein